MKNDTSEINRKIDIIVYGDFDDDEGLRYKSVGAMKYIDTFKKMNILGQVLCRDCQPQSILFKRVIPLGSIVPRFFALIQKYTGIRMRYVSQHILFDYFASKKIKSHIALSYAQGLNRCLAQVKKKGGVYVEISTTENLEVFLEKLKRECDKFNLKLPLGIKKTFLSCIKTAREADYIITISEHAKSTYLEKGFNEPSVFVIPQTIDISRFSNIQKIKHQEFRILCVAHFQILKGLHYLIEAWKKLNLNNAELLIVGKLDKNSQVAVDKLTKYIKSNAKIKFFGDVKNPDYYYSISDVFVLPSLCEGYGRAVAEAMACGLPVIVTDACGVEVRDAIDGFVIRSRDIDQLKQKIEYFYSNRSKINEMGNNARIMIGKTCDTAKTEHKIKETIEKILRNEKLI